MNCLSIIILVIVCSAYSCLAQKQELRWGEFGYYSNWDRYSFAINSDYQFIGRLPDLREFPKLLEAAIDPKLTRSERKILTSQLRTLSRCDFEKLLYANDDADSEYLIAIQKWKNWWDTYGSELASDLEESGQRHNKAWKQIAPTPYLEVPKYPILIPNSWSSIISFRSGDYGGVTEEVIEFRVNEDACSLHRKYRTGWMGKENWIHEVWTDFTREEAAHFMAALIYAIDNPWFYGSDELAENKEGEDQLIIGHIRGRPEAWSDYYPGYKWSGILDRDENVIINHDPWRWDTIDYDLGPQTNLDNGTFGVVFRLVRDLFPDPSWDSDSSRWKQNEDKEK